MFSWYKYLIVGLDFSRLGFWSGNLFLIAPFPDLCLLVPFFSKQSTYVCFIDFKKTFGTVNGELLWYKLMRIGITGRILDAVQIVGFLTHTGIICF